MKADKIPVVILLLTFVVFRSFSYSQIAWTAPKHYQEMTNPVPAEDASVKTGAALYKQHCSSCHGVSGKGNGPASIALNPRPADHTRTDFQKQSDGSLYWKISEGRGAMPPWKNTLSANDRWKLVHFIRSISAGEKKAAPKPGPQPLQAATHSVSPAPVLTTMPEAAKDSVRVIQDTTWKASLREMEKRLQLLQLTADSLRLKLDEQSVSIKAEKRSASKKFLASGTFGVNSFIQTDLPEKLGVSATFLPLFIWKPHDRFLIESHFHIDAGNTLEAGHGHGTEEETYFQEPSASISSFFVNYFLTSHITLVGGYFPVPFGIYNERIHPEWINKFPDSPLGNGHGQSAGPNTDLGLQMRGGFKFLKSRLNYAVYISNGPQLQQSGENSGQLLYGSASDNNNNKAVGGRIGLLPFHRSTLEIGAAFQYTKVGNEGTDYEGIYARMAAADLSFNLHSKRLGGEITFRSQYTLADVDNAQYTVVHADKLSAPVPFNGNDTITYYFINQTTSAFGAISYRPSFSEKKVLSRMEWVFRYDEMSYPSAAIWEFSDQRYTIGWNYWIEPRSVIKLAFQSGAFRDLILFQTVIGF